MLIEIALNAPLHTGDGSPEVVWTSTAGLDLTLVCLEIDAISLADYH